LNLSETRKLHLDAAGVPVQLLRNLVDHPAALVQEVDDAVEFRARHVDAARLRYRPELGKASFPAHVSRAVLRTGRAVSYYRLRDRPTAAASGSRIKCINAGAEATGRLRAARVRAFENIDLRLKLRDPLELQIEIAPRLPQLRPDLVDDAAQTSIGAALAP